MFISVTALYVELYQRIRKEPSGTEGIKTGTIQRYLIAGYDFRCYSVDVSTQGLGFGHWAWGWITRV